MHQRGRSIIAVVLTWALAWVAGHVTAGAEQAQQRQFVAPPPGFAEACKRYRWICEDRGRAGTEIGELLPIAEQINRRVNASVRELTDAENYGANDYWTLPRNGSGDCEDFVLQKYSLLLAAGVDSRDLSIAVAINREGENHAVLVLRAPRGDLVLDNLTSQIRPWNQTGYRFLAMQTSADKQKWEVVAHQPLDSQILAQR
ncbi:MAG: transglutaminase-like cysteine peptidase [Paracoccaceae bacterium]|nr:transglutaminase-like cysteine peptidase [Paracoccaceae bacterium]